MICIVSDKYETGFMLAGIKKTYKSLEDINDEKIIITENKFLGSKTADDLRKKGKILIPISIENKTVITQKFINKVIGCNINLEDIK